MATTRSRKSASNRSRSGSSGTTSSRNGRSSASSNRKKTSAVVHSTQGTRSVKRSSSSAAAGNSSHQTKRRNNARHRKNYSGLIKIALILIAIVVVAVLAIRGISGLISSGKAAEVTTLSFENDGTLTLEEVENLTAEGYDTSEAKTYVTQAIDDYNSTATGKVKLVKFKKTDDGAYLKTTYDSCDTYNDFTGYSVYAGTVGEYTTNEGVFNDIFAAVTDGVKGDVASSSDFAANSELKLIIISENITVHVDGTIKYVSNANTTVTGADTVTISPTDGNEDQAGQIYIIYE